MMDSISVLEDAIDAYLRNNVATNMPGIVLSVNEYNTYQRCDVKLAIPRLMVEGRVIGNEELIIYDVPVILPGAGGGWLTFPLQPNTPVWLSFSQRNIEDYINSAGDIEITPGDSRHFDLNDAVCFPRFPTALANGNPSLTNVELKFNNHLISLRPSGEILITNGSSKITFNPNGDIEIDPAGKLKVLGDVDVTGRIDATVDVKGGGVSLKDHLTSGVTPGGGTSGAPIPS